MKGYGYVGKYLAGRWRTVMAYDGKMRLVVYVIIPVPFDSFDSFRKQATAARWMLSETSLNEEYGVAEVTVCHASLIDVTTANDQFITEAYLAFEKKVRKAVFGAGKVPHSCACGVKALGIAESTYDDGLTDAERAFIARSLQKSMKTAI